MSTRARKTEPKELEHLQKLARKNGFKTFRQKQDGSRVPLSAAQLRWNLRSYQQRSARPSYQRTRSKNVEATGERGRPEGKEGGQRLESWPEGQEIVVELKRVHQKMKELIERLQEEITEEKKGEIELKGIQRHIEEERERIRTEAVQEEKKEAEQRQREQEEEKKKKQREYERTDVKRRAEKEVERPSKKTETFTVATFNVQNFEAGVDRVEKWIDTYLQSSDVLCIQESLLGQYIKVKGFTFIGECKAERLPNGVLTNSIYVKENTFTSLHVQTLSFGTDVLSVARCAALVTMTTAGGRSLRIATVHLPGGRFEDSDFIRMFNPLRPQNTRPLEEAKRTVLERVITAWDPHLIVGDFNAELDDSRVERILASYNVYQTAKSKGPEYKEAFLRYWLGGVQPYLESKGYESTYTAKQVESTSRYGTAVDFMFYRKNYLRPTIPLTVYNTALSVSDHAAVSARFEFLA